jgi:regulator of RNase E activity RraA
MTPGPGFRIRVNIDRPSPNLIETFRKFDSPDISDMLNRMYTMSPEIRALSGNGRLVGPACTVKVFPGDNLMVQRSTWPSRRHRRRRYERRPKNAVLGDLVSNKAKYRP